MCKYCIALDKMLLFCFFFNPKVLLFFLFPHKNVCCGYSLEALAEALLMSTHNKIWTTPFDYLLMCLIIARWVTNNVDPDKINDFLPASPTSYTNVLIIFLWDSQILYKWVFELTEKQKKSALKHITDSWFYHRTQWISIMWVLATQ